MSLGIHSEVDEQRSEVGLFLEITLSGEFVQVSGPVVDAPAEITERSDR